MIVMPPSQSMAALEAEHARVLRQTPRPAPGTLLTTTPLGFHVAGAGKKANFNHPFQALLVGGALVFSKGIVISTVALEPVIKRVPVSGSDKQEQPRLELDAKMANADGVSWACIEAEPDSDGVLNKDSRCEVVHSNHPVLNGPTFGRTPVCMILWQDGAAVGTLQIAMFNLRLEVRTPAAGATGTRRIFFR
jgi:hypothetical protein